MTDTINFSFFGEQLLHPKFVDCMEYVKKRPKGKKIVIFSNFLCMTDKVMKALIDVEPAKVCISINAISQQSYDEVRGGKYCLDLDGNIHVSSFFDILVDKVRRWFTVKHPRTRHEFVVSSYTVDYVEPFVKQWLPLLGKSDDILLKRILTYGGVMPKDAMTTCSSCKMWNDNYLVVSWDGLVSPCFLDNGMKLVIGSAVDTTLEHIQNGTMRNNIRKAAMARTIEPCVKCCDASHSIDTVVYRKGDTYTEKTSKWRQQ